MPRCFVGSEPKTLLPEADSESPPHRPSIKEWLVLWFELLQSQRSATPEDCDPPFFPYYLWRKF